MKYIKYGAFALILSPFFVYAAPKVVPIVAQAIPTISSWDHKAAIQTEDGKLIKVYRFDDTEKKTSCYVSYMNGFTNGMSLGISCVK